MPNRNTVAVTATSVADPGKSATALVTITSSIQVTTSPSGFTGVDLNSSHEFTATIANDPDNLGVSWTLVSAGCAGAACGTLSATSTASGVPVTYTAPATVPTPATVRVVAISIADYAKTAGAAAVVTTPGVVTVVVSPASVSTCTRSPATGCTSQRAFTAHVFNDPDNAGVTWAAGRGSISPAASPSGVPVTYTPQLNSCGSTFVGAASVTDPTRSGTALVTLYIWLAHNPCQPIN